MAKKLEICSLKEGITIAEIVRKAIKEYLEDIEGKECYKGRVRRRLCNGKTKNLAVRVEDKYYRKLREIAETLGTSRQALIREVIRRYLDRYCSDDEIEIKIIRI